MIELLNTGAYLVNGIDIIPDTEEGRAELKARTGAVPCPADAAKETIAYGILKDHNVSGNMENLQIKFDKLTSHDITFVGIIQTARASGLEKFPVPYVLTNCHNSLCAVGGTINEDDHLFGLTCAKKYGVDFTLRKDATTQPPHYIVIFKAKDADNMEQAFKEFTAKKLQREERPSIRKDIAASKEKAAARNADRAKEKFKERGLSR